MVVSIAAVTELRLSGRFQRHRQHPVAQGHGEIVDAGVGLGVGHAASGLASARPAVSRLGYTSKLCRGQLGSNS